MRQRHGVILLDDSEIIFRIYETTDAEWKLSHYYSSIIKSSSPQQIQANDILEIIGDFFATEYAQHIAEWKIGSRHLSTTLTHEISRTLDIPIENISKLREQELLCKGIFTELW